MKSDKTLRLRDFAVLHPFLRSNQRQFSPPVWVSCAVPAHCFLTPRRIGGMAWGMSDVELIRSIPIFAGLSESGLSELSAAMQFRSYPAQSFIVKEEEPGHELFLIRSGRVEVVRHVGGPDETCLAILEARDFFGEMSLIEARVHSASVRALEPCELLVLKSADLYRLFQHQMDQYAIVILNIARDLCRRLRALDEVYTGTKGER